MATRKSRRIRASRKAHKSRRTRKSRHSGSRRKNTRRIRYKAKGGCHSCVSGGTNAV